MIIDSPIISGSQNASGPFTQIGNVQITGSLSVTGTINGSITGSVTSASYATTAEFLDGLDSTSFVFTSSFNTFSGSAAGRITDLEAFSSSLDATFATDASVSASILVLSQSVEVSQAALSSSYTITSGSYASASGSLSIRTTNLEATSSTLVAASSSFAADSASLSARLTGDETNITTLTSASGSFAAQSASLSTRITQDETNFTNLSSSFATTSGSLSTRVTNLESTSSTVSSSFASTSGSISGRVTLIEGQYATTGSNVFTGPQFINEASNAIGFTSTASLYTPGGARITKDLFVSGTSYFNNVVVYGTSSIQYITSSQVNFGTNIITVNTDTPAVRFGGLAVFDSGSTQLTGSMLWDSERNHWVYANPSGSTYSGGMIMSGPRAQTLGSEQGTTSCAIMIGQGGDHITSSMIYSYGNATCFYGQSFISSSGAACFASTVCAPAFVGGTISGTTGTFSGNVNVTVANTPEVLLTHSDTSKTFLMAVDGNNAFFRANSTNNILFQYAGGTTALNINGSTGAACFNNLITACSAFLQVPSTAAVVDILRLNNPSVVNSGTRLKFENGYGDLAAIRVIHRDNGALADDGQIEFQVGSNAVLDTKMTILNTGQVGIGTTSPDIFGRGDGFDVGISSAGVGSTQNMSLQLNAGGSAGRGAQLYMGQGGTRHFTISSNTTETSIGTTSNTPLRFVTCDSLERLRFTNTGIACFACQVCAPSFIGGTISGTTGAFSISAGTPLQAYQTSATNSTTAIIRQTGAGGNGNQDIGLLVDIQGVADNDRIVNFRYFDGTNYNSRFNVQRGGNVGIGTTTPCAKLDISYANTATGVRLVGGAGACCGNLFRSYITDYSDQSPINLFWADHGNPARTNTLVRIHTNETAAGGYPLRITAQGSLCSPTYEALAINYQGNVGIGTTVGTAALGIGGGDAQTTANLTDAGTRKGMIEIIPVGGAAGYGGALVLGSDTWGNGAGRGQIALKALLINGSGCGTSDLAFSLRNDPSCSNLTERMRITVGGNVGIGTTTPAEKLDIVGPNGSVATMRWRNEGGRKSGYLYSDSVGVAIYDTNINDAGIYLAQNSQIDFRVGGAQKMIITCGGLILACGRTSSIMASSGNIQEWVGLTGTIANNTGWSLFSITNQYDNLSMDIYVFTDVGSFQASKHEAVFGYTSGTYTGIGFSSAFCIFRTGTTFNETMTICNLSGSNITSQRIAIRVWGYGVGQNGTGGTNLLTTSCLTRIS